MYISSSLLFLSQDDSLLVYSKWWPLRITWKYVCEETLAFPYEKLDLYVEKLSLSVSHGLTPVFGSLSPR